MVNAQNLQKNFKNHKRWLKSFSYLLNYQCKFFWISRKFDRFSKMNRRSFRIYLFCFFFNKSLKDDVVDGMKTPIDSVMSNLMARLRWLITGMRHLPVKDFTREDFQNFMLLHPINRSSTDGIILQYFIGVIFRCKINRWLITQIMSNLVRKYDIDYSVHCFISSLFIC